MRPDGKWHTRAYSIASPPRTDGTFDVVLNRVEEGFMSNWLCDIEVGTDVSFHGPHGLFTMREPKHDAVFIATGTGIAPFRSMVQWLFAEPERNQGRQIWLVLERATSTESTTRKSSSRSNANILTFTMSAP